MPRPPSLPQDWLFGAPGKRRLLAYVLERRPPPEGWTEAELARGAGLGPNGSVTPHLDALQTLDLLRRRGGRYELNAASPLVRPIRQLLRVLTDLAK